MKTKISTWGVVFFTSSTSSSVSAASPDTQRSRKGEIFGLFGREDARLDGVGGRKEPRLGCGKESAGYLRGWEEVRGCGGEKGMVVALTMDAIEEGKGSGEEEGREGASAVVIADPGRGTSK